MEEYKLIKYEGGLLKSISTAISVANKLLALTEPQLIPYRKKDKWGFCTPDKKIICYTNSCTYAFYYSSFIFNKFILLHFLIL